MNVTPYGAVPSIRSTIISKLGLFPTNMSIGDEQCMNFEGEDDSQFCLSDEEKMSSKYYKNIGPIKHINNSKAELLIPLIRDGYDTTKTMVKRWTNIDIPTKKSSNY